MTSRELSNGILRTISILALIVLGGYLCYTLSALIIYGIVSVLFVLLANPVIAFLRKRLKFGNTLAVITALVLFLLLFIGFLLLFVPLIITQGKNLSLVNINEMEHKYNEILTSVTQFLHHYNYNFNPADLLSGFNLNFVSNMFNSFVSVLGNIGMGVGSVFFISFFLLKQKDSFYNAFQSVLPEKQKDKILISLEKIAELLSRYFGGLVLQLSIIFILYLIVFLIFGVENALTIALLCAIFNIIPYLGSILGMITASGCIMISGIELDFVNIVLPKVFYVLIGMGIVQAIDNNISQPIIFSKRTDSHPLEIFLVILASGTLFGIVGMIVAVPTYTSLKVIAKEFFPNNKLVQIVTKKI